MSAEMRVLDATGIWQRFERAPIVPTAAGSTWTASYTDNANGTWTSTVPVDNGDGTWSY